MCAGEVIIDGEDVTDQLPSERLVHGVSIPCVISTYDSRGVLGFRSRIQVFLKKKLRPVEQVIKISSRNTFRSIG